MLLNAFMLPAVLIHASSSVIYSCRLLASAMGASLTALHTEAIFVAARQSTDKSRHKVNPGLLYTPQGADGIGLVSMDVAICT